MSRLSIRGRLYLEEAAAGRPRLLNLTGAGGGSRFPIQEQRSPMPDELRKAEVIETTIGKLAEAAAELARRGLSADDRGQSRLSRPS